MAKMDEAAEDAKKELDSLPKEAVEALSKWWAKWYATAGHKRLGRVLVEKSNGK